MERLSCVVIGIVYEIVMLVGCGELDSWNIDNRERVLS